jgi:hypothetical protein
LQHINVGSKIWFEEEKQGYTIQARSDDFIVCSKPFNPKKTVLYTIIDIKRNIRGPENLIFGAGAETREQCEEMINRLTGVEKPQTEVSYRNNIPVKIRKVSES